MRSPPRQVPTLTEVVDVNAPRPAGAPGAVATPSATPAGSLAPSPAAGPAAAPLAAAAPAQAPAQAPTLAPQRSFIAPTAGPARRAGAEPEAAAGAVELLSQRVLADLQRELDPLLEQRVRELLAPALARATEAMAQQLRDELAVAMREMVAHAVAQELARLRKP
jgi:hypothetical protein